MANQEFQRSKQSEIPEPSRCFIQIINTPAGSAPEHIRALWNEVILPAIGPINQPSKKLHPFDPLTGEPIEIQEPVYRVGFEQAMRWVVRELPEEEAQELADWFVEHAYLPSGIGIDLLFNASEIKHLGKISVEADGSIILSPA
ncbi:hypothetical protein GYA49_00115 [Candidatus Beckwithbacteria bacterium]|nr:hypothetical protein [Candidatus Beckwithbacteria bacterium]